MTVHAERAGYDHPYYNTPNLKMVSDSLHSSWNGSDAFIPINGLSKQYSPKYTPSTPHSPRSMDSAYSSHSIDSVFSSRSVDSPRSLDYTASYDRRYSTLSSGYYSSCRKSSSTPCTPRRLSYDDSSDYVMLDQHYHYDGGQQANIGHGYGAGHQYKTGSRYSTGYKQHGMYHTFDRSTSMIETKRNHAYYSDTFPRNGYIKSGSVINLERISERPSISANLSSVSELHERPVSERVKSKSVGDLRLGRDGSKTSTDSYSDDDGDDYGFLSYPFVYTCSAMIKSKASSPGNRILPKRWKSRTSKRSQSVTATPFWSPEGSCTWCSVSGRKVILKPVSLLQLTECERLALQKIALAKLQTLDLDCPVNIPKENTGTRKPKRRMLSLKRRSHTTNLADTIEKAEKLKDKESGLVFGIPLSKCIANDIELQKRRNSGPLKERRSSTDGIQVNCRHRRRSSSSSQGSVENPGANGTVDIKFVYRKAASTDSLVDSESSRNTSSSLLDAESFSTSRHGSMRRDPEPPPTASPPKVPHIVQTCFRHIETYGLRVLGIFRVGSSKKRTKQLRDEFDSGKDVKLNEEHNPHEVGAVLKEYFRDLPEPLLTRDLYSPFVATRKLSSSVQELATTLLICLLPVANRETLWVLLKFLSKVDEHSSDAVDSAGHVLPGNKMDAHNLATLFGPNILHKAKSSMEKEYLVESTERAEERKEVIEVIKDMVLYHYERYQLPAEIYHEVLKVLMVTEPDNADQILKRLSNESNIEQDPESVSSGVFEDSDQQIASCPQSDADLVHMQAMCSRGHQKLRAVQSADVLTPDSKRRLCPSHSQPTRQSQSDMCGESERPVFTLTVESTPSPHLSASRSSLRSPRIQSSSDSSSPQVMLRTNSAYSERPKSENFSNVLGIPAPLYLRKNSTSSMSSYVNTSSTNSPPGSEHSGQWVMPTPPASHSNSPKSSRKITSSMSRPLDVRTPPPGSAEWQKERWKHWELLAAESDDSGGQETLV